MAEVIEYEISSWDQFSEYARRFTVGQQLAVAYLFRGQGQDLPLNPRLARRISEVQTLEQIFALEASSRALFEKQAHLYLPPSLSARGTGDISIVVAMQHYGIPTRILDWTRSMYVAAYFAVSEYEHSGDDGVIWAIQGKWLSEASVAEYEDYVVQNSFDKTYHEGEFPPDLKVLQIRKELDRAAVQQSVFTISRDPRVSHEDVIRTLTGLITRDESNEVITAKLLVKSDAKYEIHRQLHAANVSAATLFPGIDGFGKSVGESLERAIKYEVDRT